MATQTSLVAQQVRLQQWAEQIRDCQSRPKGSLLYPMRFNRTMASIWIRQM